MSSPRITKQRFTLSPFTSQQMVELGEVVLKSVKDRIHRGQTVDESPATPLKQTVFMKKGGGPTDLIPYPEQKARKGRQPFRDLMMTGGLMNSIKVVSANENRCVIAANNAVKDRVLHLNNIRSKQFGLSSHDKEVMEKKILEMLKESLKITVA